MNRFDWCLGQCGNSGHTLLMIIMNEDAPQVKKNSVQTIPPFSGEFIILMSPLYPTYHFNRQIGLY